MFNSQGSRQELMERIFMLMAQNSRLNIMLKQASNPPSNVLNRIAQIQKQLGMQLSGKDRKIQQLYAKIRVLHNNNTELSEKYENHKNMYKDLQTQYCNEISEYKAKQSYRNNIQSQTISIKQYQHKVQEYESLIKNERQELQVYRSEEKKRIENEREDMREKYGKQKQILVKEIQGIKHQCQRAKKSEYESRRVQVELRKLLKEREGELSRSQRKRHEIQKQVRQSREQVNRKSQKLKEYDSKYSVYSNKMSSLTSQSKKLKQTNINLMNTIKAMQQENRKKESSSSEIQKLNQNYHQQISKYTQQVNTLQTQLQKLKQQLQQHQRTNTQKQSTLVKERDQAIKQWEELLQEMGKQKTIIYSLQKEVQSHRKNRTTQEIVKKIVNQELKEIKHHHLTIQQHTSNNIQQQSTNTNPTPHVFNFMKNKIREETEESQASLSQIEKEYEVSLKSSNCTYQQYKQAHKCTTCEQCSISLPLKTQTTQSIDRIHKKYNYSQQLPPRARTAEKQNNIARNPYLNKQKNIRSQSLKKSQQYPNNKENQIQKYVSFQLQPKQTISRTTSDRKFTPVSSVPQSDRLKTYGIENNVYEDEKQVLVEKIEKINSWRNEPAHAKNLGYYKRSAMNSGRLGLHSNGRKQDMNQIIRRKCQYILDK